MNKLAEQLIDRLRNDAYTRKHFDMHNWVPLNTKFAGINCNTVGCIAGTAVAMARLAPADILNANQETKENFFIKNGAEVLGIEDRLIALHLFVPAIWANYVKFTNSPWDYLSHNERPNLDTVEKMKQYAAQFSFHKGFIVNGRLEYPSATQQTPDAAANALEAIVKDGMSYVDWAAANCVKENA